MNDNLKKSFLKIEYEFIGYFFGVMGGLAYLFMFFDLLKNVNKQLLEGTFVIYLTIEIFCFGLGYGSLNKKMNYFFKPQHRYNLIKNIFRRIVNIIKKPFKNDSLFNLTNYIIAFFIGILLFIQLEPNIYLHENISILFVTMFYVFEASYFVFFTILILIEIKNFNNEFNK